MAINTYQTYVLVREIDSSASDIAHGWFRLPNIKDYPDLDGEDETVDVTTLDDNHFVNVAGIESVDEYQFIMNYDADDCIFLEDLKGREYYYAIAFGKQKQLGDIETYGQSGMIAFKGQIVSVKKLGASVNEARNMSITIRPTSDNIDLSSYDYLTGQTTHFFGKSVSDTGKIYFHSYDVYVWVTNGTTTSRQPTSEDGVIYRNRHYGNGSYIRFAPGAGRSYTLYSYSNGLDNPPTGVDTSAKSQANNTYWGDPPSSGNSSLSTPDNGVSYVYTIPNSASLDRAIYLNFFSSSANSFSINDNNSADDDGIVENENPAPMPNDNITPDENPDTEPETGKEET